MGNFLANTTEVARSLNENEKNYIKLLEQMQIDAIYPNEEIQPKGIVQIEGEIDVK